MAIVFITQDLGTVNFTPACEFGTLRVAIDRYVSNVGLSAAFDELRGHMRGIKPCDWIVPVGHPALIGYACYVMAEQTGMIRLLVWDRRELRYIPTEVKT